MSETKLKLFRADLHIHTCLSPCGDWDMSPALIVDKCCEKNLDIIAITDHNTVENAHVVMKLGKKKGLSVLPSMEICSVEEVHVLAIFDNIETAEKMQTFIYNHLEGENNPEVFGYQVVANENDEVVDQSHRLLIGATSLSLNAIIEKIQLLNGISIAAHIDKTAFSLLGQLGFIPPDLPLDGVEVSFREKPENASEKLLFGMKLPCITSSDAHFPEEIGRVSTKFLMAEPTIEEMKKALRGEDGRSLKYSLRSHS